MHLLIVFSKRKWLRVSEPSPLRSGLLLTRWDTSGNFCSFIKLLWILSRTMNSACRIKTNWQEKPIQSTHTGRVWKRVCVFPEKEAALQSKQKLLMNHLSAALSLFLSCNDWPAAPSLTAASISSNDLGVHQWLSSYTQICSREPSVRRSFFNVSQTLSIFKNIMNNSVRCPFFNVFAASKQPGASSVSSDGD